VVKSNFFGLHQNIRSLNKNIDQLKSALIYCRRFPEFIALSETWLKNDEEKNLGMFEIPNYILESQCRKTGNHGGVGIYLRKDIEYVTLDYSVKWAESIWIELPKIKLAGKPMVVGVIYSSMIDRNLDEFVMHLEDILIRISSEHKSVVLTGDFNIDLFKAKLSDSYPRMLLGTGFKNTIQFPTRFTEQNNSLLDHILTNIDDQQIEMTAGIIDLDITDHAMTFLSIEGPIGKVTEGEKSVGKKFDFRNYNKDVLYHELSLVNWADINFSDIEVGYSQFIEKVRSAQDLHLPLVDINPRRKGYETQDWITPDIKQCIKRRYQLYRRCKARPNNENLKVIYRRYRNWLNGETKRKRNDYNRQLLRDAQGDAKKTWISIKKIIGASGNVKSDSGPRN
jgi:exonuclease III